MAKTFKIFLFLFLCSLFFPIRKVFFTNSAYLTGTYSDFTSFSLYLSDILLFTTWFFVLTSRGGAREWAHHVVKGSKWLIIWLILAFLWHITSANSLNWYFLLKYAELIVAYGTFAYIFSKFELKHLFLKVFIFFASIQSIIAITQFKLQHSVGFGLNILGETLISPKTQGIAKIVSGGTVYIRGYGTFPHPNILAAFLVTAILIALYFNIKNKAKTQIWYYLALIINILGLTVTFSRAGYLAALVGISILLISAYRVSKKLNLKAILLVFAAILLSFVLFRPFILTRATISDSSTLQRMEYNKIGIKMVSQNPIFGVGIGESVLHMEQYAKKPLNPWEKQPIHNYFIIAAAELGIPFSLILIWVFFWHLNNLAASIKYQASSKSSLTTSYLLLATFLSFLLLMMFDHYFYTIQQTQLLLWIILGIIAAQTKNPHPQTTEVDLSTKN